LTDDELYADLTPSEHNPRKFWSALDQLAHLIGGTVGKDEGGGHFGNSVHRGFS
jgi:hypothetical protein